MLRERVVVALVVVTLIISLVGAGSTFAQNGSGGFTATPLTPDSTDQISKPDNLGGKQPSTDAATTFADSAGMVSVIVKLDVDSVASYDGSVPGLAATNPTVAGTDKLDLNSPTAQQYQAYVDGIQQEFEATATRSLAGAEITNRFDVILGGVSMVIPADQISTLTKLPGVVAVYPDELLHLDTDNSPQFIGAPTAWNLAGGQESAGEDVVVGVLDTGIWPEHPSFSDPDPSGKPYGPLATWNGTSCQFGSAVPGDVPFTCNNKLVGAARFMATYSALNTLLPDEYLSARDDDGHGTHTSSTATGNANVAASIFGVPRGVISGIAPRARVAMYKVCGDAGCYSSDSAAAVQQAIQDGVNVINFSISGGTNPYSDAVSLAFLDAYNAGVFVAASAGNSGPSAETTGHREPWVMTVAASTHDRAFENTATVTADGGASLALTGASITQGVGPAPVVIPASDVQCNAPFAAGSVAGQIVVCQRGTTGRAEKGYNVLQGGAVGMILYNQSTAVTDLETDNHYLPTIHVQYVDGAALLNFIAANTNVQATLTAGVKVAAQGDVMASFSSRGGPGQTLGVSKPDITAPGVQILAGHSPQHLSPPAGVALGPQGELFQSIAGTSMSSPHIAGAGALIKALHPDWSPGQIKSALMTTANTSVVKEDGVTPATPFDDGSGRVDLNQAGTAGLTFNETGENYLTFQDHLWDANYPSLYVPVMPGSITVKRTVHNETNQTRTWKLSVSSPPDVKVTVPKSIRLKRNGLGHFDIKVDAPQVPLGEVRHAMVVFTSGSEQLHFPITIVRRQPAVTLTKTCDPATITKYDPRVGVVSTTTCAMTIQNNSFTPATVSLYDRLPKQLQLVGFTGGLGFAHGVTFDGVLAGAQPPDITIGPGVSPAGGYLPLSAFGIAPISGVGDDTITNFNVPAFVYAGQTYTRLGVGSNGTLVVGGSAGATDATPVNQSFPDDTRPNNVLAPFWTDLNPATGGAVRIATLTDGVNTWIVVDWDAVREFSSPNTNTFEVWIGINGMQDISYAYGPIGGTGDGGLLTVGAENEFGNRGQNYYYNGTGTLPGNGTQLVVSGVPGAAGEIHVVTATAKGVRLGAWTNCAELDADLIAGTNIACASGEVIR